MELEERRDDGRREEERERGKPTLMQPIWTKGFIVFGQLLACWLLETQQKRSEK